jgi:hypothetical protein
MSEHHAAHHARSLLHAAARRLNTADPTMELGDVLDASLARPAGDTAYRSGRTLEPRFAETSAGSLAFDLLPGGPRASASDRLTIATDTMRRSTQRHFGGRALRWLDGRLEVAGGGGSRHSTWGASLGSGFGRDGLLESAVSLEWGPQYLESLPAPLHRVVQIVLDSLPGLRPSFSTVRTTHHGGSQQVTFDVPRALPLSSLAPLMTRLGLGHRHAGLVSAVALLLGARYTLPPDAGLLTVRAGPRGVELRLDVDLDAIPDPPHEITRLLHLQLAERPRSLRALHRWVAALTPDGYDGPGRLSVLSVAVRPDLPARIALNLLPAGMEARAEDDREQYRDDVPASAWTPVGAAR